MKSTVYFRCFEEDDAPLIYKWMNDDELKSMSIGLNRRMSKEEALNWVKARINHSPYQVWWAICAVDSDKMIGYMSLTDIHYINSSACFSGIVLGDKDYSNGFAWIESYLFVREYAFERLNLNRLYGEHLVGHKQTEIIGKAFFQKEEGILRQAVFKNGKYYDVRISSILRSEYFEHKEKGDFEIRSIIKRFRKNNN